MDLIGMIRRAVHEGYFISFFSMEKQDVMSVERSGKIELVKLGEGTDLPLELSDALLVLEGAPVVRVDTSNVSDDE